jgi:mannose-1-phosphate guanylyltransferase / mannose-6-phosphate isomerase
MTITPVILSGGSGTRLWPLSRELYPKQFLPLVGQQSMLQETLAMTQGRADCGHPMVVGNEAHRFIIAQQAQEIGCQLRPIVLEPVARNTAPAVATAAVILADDNPDALMLVLPADHSFGDRNAFMEAVSAAAPAAAAGQLVTFGVKPSRPETGYGYIQPGAAGRAGHTVLPVTRFVEKPDADRAAQFVADGYFWNAGIFLFRAATLLAEMQQHAPDVVAAARAAVSGGAVDLDFFRLEKTAFAAAPSISIDHAVMEKTAMAAVQPINVGWTDVGAWSALWDIGAKDSDGNVLVGDAMAPQSRNTYIRSEGKLTVVLGVDDVIVVSTDDVVLVAAKDKSQEIKPVVEALRAAGREEADAHVRVYRPWGFYQSVHAGDRFQVKRLTVYPGQKPSLQKHFHRAEHWVVVNGTAIVTRDDEEILLRENESVYLPLGCVHRLANPGRQPLNIIEVQSGSYLGEDDIVRIEDTYGRK